MRVGDVVLAVGNPLGVGQTVTMGIVSAKGRATGGGDDSFEDFIQTDAPINQGNSGGALVSTRGELVGINSQILSPSGGNIGIGFAIPANMAKNVMTQLIDQPGPRGMSAGVPGPTPRNGLGCGGGGGGWDGRRTGPPGEDGGGARRSTARRSRTATTCATTWRRWLPGSTAKLTVVRDGKEQTLNVTLAERKRLTSAKKPAAPGRSLGRLRHGSRAADAGPAPRSSAVPTSSGVLVSEVQPGGRAADAGLRPGDVIIEVDRHPVNSPDALRSALKERHKPALLLVQRGQATVFLTLDRQ